MKESSVTVLLFLVIVYALLGAYFSLSLPIGSGDEQLFISDINLVNQQGWIKAIEKGISIPHALLVYPLTWFFESHLALRILNIGLLIVLYVYLYCRNKPSLWFFIYLTFFLGTSKVFFTGTNDALFILGLVVFLNEIHQIDIGKLWKCGLGLSALFISLFTRELIMVYLPIVLLGVCTVIKKKKIIKKQLILPVLMLFLLLAINIPSFKTNGKLSYDQKLPPNNVDVSWSQRQYLAQMLVNEGKLSNYQHPTFLETQKYVDKHGINSLPKTVFQGILFNPKLTIIEFFKDFFHIILYGSRQLGLILLIVLGYFFINIKKFLSLKREGFIPLALITIVSIFSLIIISYVELRWLMPIFIMAIVYFAYLEKHHKIDWRLLRLNQYLTILLVFYGVYRIIPLL